MGVLTMMKGIPMAYDKDMQEDKEGVFDAIDNLKFALTIYAAMIDKMTVNGKHMREVLESDFSNATDMADYLAKKGLPFREAHAVVGRPSTTASNRARYYSSYRCRNCRP